MNKYVISAELEYVPGLETERITAFRDSLTADLTAMGEDVEWVAATELQSGLKKLRDQVSLPVISLDGSYYAPGEGDDALGISRAVQPGDLLDAGYDSRLGYPPLVQQLDRLGERYEGQDVALLDDVLFTGSMVGWVRGELARRGVGAPLLLCGIAIGDGQELLAGLGIETRSVRYYQTVTDQLCERDFTYLPGSGRKVIGQEQSVPYFDPESGKPGEWASIKDIAAFCLGSIQRNLDLLPLDMALPDFLGYPEGRVGEILPAIMAARSKT